MLLESNHLKKKAQGFVAIILNAQRGNISILENN
jgi:hypothetical protein